VGMEAADEAQFVHMPGHVGEQLRDPRPRLSMPSEAELGSRQRAAPRTAAAVIALQAQLVLEGVHLRQRPFHEQEDDALRFDGIMRPPRRQRPLRRIGRGPLCMLSEHSGESNVAKPRTCGFERLATGENGTLVMHRITLLSDYPRLVA